MRSIVIAGIWISLHALSCGPTLPVSGIAIEAGADQQVWGMSTQLHGSVSNRRPLRFWTADGNNLSEDMLVRYDSNSGISYVGPLRGRRLIFGWPGDLERIADVTYGVDVQHRRLYRLDLKTGICSPLRSRIKYKRVFGLAYDETRRRLYGIDQATRTLLLLDAETGDSTVVSMLPDSHEDVRGLAYNSIDNGIYYSDESTEAIYRMDPRTGDTRLVLEIPDGPDAALEELAFYDGRLLGSLALFHKEKNLWSMQLMEIDIRSGTGWWPVGPEIEDVSPHCLLVDSIPERIFWRQTHGPGTSVFADRSGPETTVTFSKPGTYILELVVEATPVTLTDSLTIRVLPD